MTNRWPARACASCSPTPSSSPAKSSAKPADGIAALEFLRDHPVDVVLADIRMPCMDGIELAGHLGAFPAPPAVIFTTAYDNYAG